MKNHDLSQRNLLRIGLTLFLAILLLGTARDMQAYYAPLLEGAQRISYTLLIHVLFAVLVSLVILIQIWAPKLFAPFRKIRAHLSGIRWLVIIAVGILASSFFLIPQSAGFTKGAYQKTYFILMVLGLSAWFATDEEDKNFSWAGVLEGGILAGSIFAFAGYMQGAVNYPFSIGWSEGNRIWDYSVLYGRSIYDYPLDQSIFAYIDRGRQSLWGLPFLIPGVSIQMVRIWSGIVYTIPYALLGLFVFQDEKKNILTWLLLGLWSFLFLNQGPIYTPLVLAAILVAGSRKSPTWLGFILVALAAYYARTSRYTWLFAPAMWAGIIALVEKQPFGVKTNRQRWIRAVVLVMGGLFGGLAISQLRIYLRSIVSAGQVSNPISISGISDVVNRQPLLWSRLWPNSTFPLGIIPALLLSTGPLIALLVIFYVREHWKLNFWQLAALLGGLFAFLGVGVVASVKIGGGSNLHNLDMFLIGCLFAAGLAWEAGAREWFTQNRFSLHPWWIKLLVIAAVLYPAVMPMYQVDTFNLPSAKDANEALTVIQKNVETAKQNGQVLFMDQRQLLTFGYIQDVPLIPDYEKKYVMDQAMADNADYFAGFYQDLADHRFSMIVSEPLRVSFQGTTYEFGNENDAWVKWVSIPVLCYYEPVETFPQFGTQLLVPKPKSSPVEGVTCP